MTTTSIEKAFGNKARFLSVLVMAELNARADWECELTDAIRDRFEVHGMDTKLTSAERRQLSNLSRH